MLQVACNKKIFLYNGVWCLPLSDIKAIVGGVLINGNGFEPVEDSIIIIKGDIIEAVGLKLKYSVPDGAEVIDASGMTVMLGLIDAHVHFNDSRNHIFAERIMPTSGLRLLGAAEDAYDALKAGFTTMRGMHGAQALDLKKGIAEGTIKGPRIKASGHALSQTFGHSARIISWMMLRKDDYLRS